MFDVEKQMPSFQSLLYHWFFQNFHECVSIEYCCLWHFFREETFHKHFHESLAKYVFYVFSRKILKYALNERFRSVLKLLDHIQAVLDSKFHLNHEMKVRNFRSGFVWFRLMGSTRTEGIIFLQVIRWKRILPTLFLSSQVLDALKSFTKKSSFSIWKHKKSEAWIKKGCSKNLLTFSWNPPKF